LSPLTYLIIALLFSVVIEVIWFSLGLTSRFVQQRASILFIFVSLVPSIELWPLVGTQVLCIAYTMGSIEISFSLYNNLVT